MEVSYSGSYSLEEVGARIAHGQGDRTWSVLKIRVLIIKKQGENERERDR